MDKSNAFECQVENDSIVVNSSKSSCQDSVRPHLQPNDESSNNNVDVSSMQESRPITKKRTLKDKSTTSNKRTRTTLSSRTSPVDSTGRDRGCCPFWNNASEELSKRLWLPTKTDCVVSDWSSWSGYSKSMTSGCAFKTKWTKSRATQMNLPKIYWQSRTTLWQKITDRELQKRSANAAKRNKGRTAFAVKFKASQFNWELFRELHPETINIIVDDKTDPIVTLVRVFLTSHYPDITIKRDVNGRREIDKKYAFNAKSKQELDTFLDASGMGRIVNCSGVGSEIMCSRRHKIVTTPDMKCLFRQWFGLHRKIYNICVSLLNNVKDGSGPKQTSSGGIKTYLRSYVGNKKSINEHYPTMMYLAECPEPIRDAAITEIATSYNTNIKLGKKLGDFAMAFKSRRSLYQTTTIKARDWHNGQPYYKCWLNANLKDTNIRFTSKTHQQRLRKTENAPSKEFAIEKLSNSSKLLYCRATKDFYLIIPSVVPAENIQPAKGVGENQTNHPRLLFMDPGVRTFQTGYDPEGNILEFGIGYDKIFNSCCVVDKLVSMCDKKTKHPGVCHRTLHKIRSIVLPRLRYRLRNRRNDFHNKVAKFICENYSDVHVPAFETQRMIDKNKVRGINNKTARMMCTWSHYSFEQKLKYYASRSGTSVHIANESYTSKTCGRCGVIRSSFSGKEFVCPSCGLVLDRDAHAARNILIRQCCIGI